MVCTGGDSSGEIGSRSTETVKNRLVVNMGGIQIADTLVLTRYKYYKYYKYYRSC
jgi:hypothetical protein